MAKTQDLIVDRRGMFRYTVQVTEGGLPKNLAGWTAKMQIRADRREDGPLLDELLSPVGGLSVVGAAGQVLIDIPGADTALYDWIAGEYDLYIYDPPTGEPHRILQGKIRVSQSVTI